MTAAKRGVGSASEAAMVSGEAEMEELMARACCKLQEWPSELGKGAGTRWGERNR